MNIVNEIITSMNKLKGNVKLKDLYKDLKLKGIHRHYLDDLSFEGTVRSVLQQNSTSNGRFNGKEIFEHVSNGVWKLKDIKEDIIRFAHPEKIILFIDSHNDEMFAISESRVFFRSIDQTIYPGIMVGSKDSLRFQIEKEPFLYIFFTDQQNREWEIGFELHKNYKIELLKLIDNRYLK